MKLHSENNTVASGVIAVVGGMIMDLVFETLRMPELDESLDASSLAHKPGGKGSNTSVAIYRAQHNKPISKPSDKPAENASATRNEGHVNASAANYENEKIEVGVFLNTAIGNDAFGKELMKKLQSNGVDVSGVRTLSNEMTGTCAVFVEELTGESRDIGYPGANTNWVPRYQDSVECLAGDQTPDLIVCHLETKRETIEKILETAAKNGVDTLLNPSPVAYLLTTVYKNVTHLVVNEREAVKLSGMPETELENLDGWKKAAKFFLDAGVKNFVITLGAKGAYYATEDSDCLVPAVKDVIVKREQGKYQFTWSVLLHLGFRFPHMLRVGSSRDTFTGNYALDYVRQKHHNAWDIRRAVERGCKAAAETMEQLGAQESIPWADEIDP